MRGIKQILAFVFVLSFLGCKNEKDISAGSSLSNINEISIIIDDILWNGEIGDSLRKKTCCPSGRAYTGGTYFYT